MPEPCVIRQAKPADRETLVPVVRDFYRHFGFAWDDDSKGVLIDRVLRGEAPAGFWLAERPAGLTGYALVTYYWSLEFDGWVGLLDELYVVSTCRGGGIGHQLIEGVSQELSALGLRRLRLEVDERHPEAASLYARSGFRPDGRQTWSRTLMSPRGAVPR